MYKDCWFHYNLCFNASGNKNYLQNRSSNQLASMHTSVLLVGTDTYGTSANYRQVIRPA